MANELDGLTFGCVPRQLAPFGPEYAGGPAGCAITGAIPGETYVTGSAYLDSALEFSKAHVWRNFGIVMAWWIFYVVMGCLAIDNIPAAGAAKGITLYKRGTVPKNLSEDLNSGDDVSEKTRVDASAQNA